MLIDGVLKIYLKDGEPIKVMNKEKSSSRTPILEVETTTGDPSPFHTGFPPGVTVDKLHRYRKKKFPAFLQLHDNIKVEEGSFQKIKSEYTRRYHENVDAFRPKPYIPEDSLKVEGNLEHNPEYYESFIEYPVQKSIVRRPKNLTNVLGMDIADEDEKTDGEQEETENPAELKHNFTNGRHYLFKRPTNLKLEGDFYSETENAEKFINYLLTGRPDLTRTPTTLKLEGDMETKTETSDKYGHLDYQSRPPLFKKSTNLHLEGIIDITTETREKYPAHETQQRAPLTKRSTNLHLEGDLTLQPEYRDVFVEHKDAERSRPKFPVNNLKSEGCINTQTEKSEKFIEHQIHPIPFLRGGDPNRTLTLGNDSSVKKAEYREKFVEHSKIERSLQHRPKSNLKSEGDMETITESKTQFVEKPPTKTAMRKGTNNLLLEGNIDMNPEYRNAYVNFYRDAYGKFGVRKDENEPEKRRRRTVSHPIANLKSEGAMETNPEYKSSFVDFPRQRPSVKKPAGHLHSESGKLSQVTEKRAQYVHHPKGPKAHPLKRGTELKLEGPFESQPEYRRAYIDYITREKVERLRPLDNLGVESSRRVFDDPSTPPPIVTEAKEGNATSSDGEVSAALPPEPTSNLPLPVIPENPTAAPRNASLSPAPKASGKKISKENLSRMENCLFGPKVPNPSGRSRSRKVTPAPEKKKLAEADRLRALRARRHYGSPVMVENLAYTPRTSPVQAILKASARWQKDQEDVRETHAFVVLSSVRDDHNPHSKTNTSLKQCDRNHVGYSELYKEQKWMPSWYASSSKES